MTDTRKETIPIAYNSAQVEAPNECEAAIQ